MIGMLANFQLAKLARIINVEARRNAATMDKKLCRGQGRRKGMAEGFFGK